MILNIEFAETNSLLDVHFAEEDSVIDLDFSELDYFLDVEFGEVYRVGGDIPLYDGDYSVTPKVTEQILDTAQTLMESDLTVEKIPYWEVSNLSNGLTVTIGSEINGSF